MRDFSEKNEDDDNYRFAMRILIIHPKLTLEEISNIIAFSPTDGHSVGDPRTTPKRELLKGAYTETKWQQSRYYEGNRDFLIAVTEAVTDLEPYVDFLIKMKETGGECLVILDLPGIFNLGSVIPFSIMRKLSEMKIDLGIEIFPESD